MFSGKKEQTTYNVAMGRILKCIMVSDRNRAQKAAYGMIPSIWPSTKGKLPRRKSLTGCGDRGRGLTPKGTWELFGMEEMFQILIVGMVMQLYNFSKICSALHLKRVNITVYKIYLNTNGQGVHENVFHITRHGGTANQGHGELTPHTC